MKKSKRIIVQLLIIVCMSSFIGVNKANATYQYYVNEAEIQINNLPKNEKVEVEVIVVKKALDFDNLDSNYSEPFKQEYFEIIKSADGVFDREETVFVGLDLQNKPKYKQEQTKYYYKALDKKTVNNGEDIKFDIYVPYSIFEEFGSSIAVRINDKYSSFLSLEELGDSSSPDIVKVYSSVDYETMKLKTYKYDEREIPVVEKILNSIPYLLYISLCIIMLVGSQLIIEYLISKKFKIGNTEIILKVNMITQFLLHIITLGISIYVSFGILWFHPFEEVCGIGTIIVSFLEFLLYKKKIKDIPLKKIAEFTIVANACSFIMSPIIYSSIRMFMDYCG